MKPTDAEKAYRQIKQLIVTTSLSPGSVISEASLMDDLELGRTPIREAIKLLQAENLVAVTPRQGMFVADVSVTDLTQIFEVRVELEALGATLAAQRITKDGREQLNQLVEEYHQIDKSDKEALIDLDYRFHRAIAEATHNNFLIKELDYFYSLSLRIWHLAINFTRPEDIDIRAHLDILEAMKDGDYRQVEQRMRTHILDFHQTIRQYL